MKGGGDGSDPLDATTRPTRRMLDASAFVKRPVHDMAINDIIIVGCF
jgi:hypothetical protein